MEAVDAGLKALAGKLAPTRDWDVFATETGAAVADALPSEQRLQRLLAATERRRRVCHNELRAFLGSTEFRRLGIELASSPADRTGTRRSETPSRKSLRHAGGIRGPRAGKRLKKLTQIDDDLAHMEPTELHAIRLHAKRLRYAAEIFAPVYPGKETHRFIRRLSRLQDRLGALNDGAVAAHLLGELTGGNHAFAIGLVLGFVGARGSDTREHIDQAWAEVPSRAAVLE